MNYEDIEDEIKQELEAIADNDPYGLSPKCFTRISSVQQAMMKHFQKYLKCHYRW